MNDIEQKALALIAPGAGCEVNFENISILARAFTSAIEQHEAAEQELSDYKQKVSDAVEGFMIAFSNGAACLPSISHLVIPAPKPDPLVEVLEELYDGRAASTVESYAACLRAALDARGLEIRGKNDDQ